MMYKINYELFANCQALPKEIFNVELDKIDGDYLKVALLLFKDTNKKYEVEEISDELNISQKKVKEALVYWNECKIVKLKQEQAQKVAPQKNTPVKPMSNVVNITNNEKVTNIDVIINENNKYKSLSKNNKLNEEVVFLLDAIQSMFKIVVSKSYFETLTYAVEQLHLPSDVILLAFHYCNETMDKFNIKYFQKVCMSWAENEINTSEKADRYLLELKSNSPEEVAVKEIFKIDRLLQPKEKEFIRTWTKDYSFNLDMIACAGELTLSKTGNYAFAYMNSILAGWYGKCLTDVSQVQQYLPEDKRNLINSIKNSPNNISVMPNTSYDIREAENMLNEVPSFI